MSDTAIVDQSALQTAAARDRAKPGKVTGKLKDALDLVVNEGIDPYEAAAKVEMSARAMRLALNKRHVLTYLRAAREVLRTTASAQNIHYAIKMRADARNEMARLGAMKFIDNQEDERGSGLGRPQVPGFVIVVQTGPNLHPTNAVHLPGQDAVPAKPLIEHTSVSRATENEGE